MLEDRPDAWLILLGMLSDDVSVENIALALPDTSPAVSVIRTLADMLRLLMHTSDVSDAHPVASHTDPPIPLTDDHHGRPSPSPATPTMTDSLDATLTVEMLLDAPASHDRIADTLPSETPPVTAIDRLRFIPWPIWHRIDESDCQPVRSLADPPTCRTCEYDASPMLVPASVTPIDPVDNLLPILLVLILASPSAEKPSVTLPSSKPAVSVTLRLIPITPLLKHLVDVSDCHDVASPAVSPVEMPGVWDPTPKLHPCTVSSIADSDAAFDPSDKLTDTMSTDKISVVVPPSCSPAVTL